MDIKMPDGTIIKNVPDNVTQEEVLERYQLGEKEQPFLEGVKERAKALVDPQTYKKIGSELANFPPINREAIGSPQDLQKMMDVALIANPVTPMAKAARYALGNREIPDAAKLGLEGIRTTVGQKLGGFAKRAEEALTSIPILGDAIKSSQIRGIEDFNRAAINRALSPAGQKLPKAIGVGHRAVDFAHTKLSSAYDDLVPKLKGELDDAFLNALNGVDDIAKQLPDEGKQLGNIINQNVLKKFDKDGKLSGEALKESLSRVKGLIRKYSKSPDPDQQLLGEGLTVVKEALDDMLKRFNPKYASQYDKLNLGFANLVRVEQAAAGAKNGIFTPAQLANAVKVTDSSLRKSAVARGKGLMQDLAVSGQNVLSQSLPDSGTALRLAPYILAGGAGYAGKEGYISPETAATVAGLSLALSPVGQSAITGLGSGLRSPIVQRSALGIAANEDLRSLRNRNLAR